MTDDMTLVREFTQTCSEQAFAALVSRYTNLVYSVALRHVANPHLAEEITQAVFIILSRKAQSLSPTTILASWLCRTARYASADAMKIQRRRQSREQETHMPTSLNATESDVWSQIAPQLDEALDCLGEKDHSAVVLRFFEGKDFKEVAAAMGTSEDAARMRVNRGIDKLRKFFTKRGLTLSTAAIAAAVSGYSVQAAPVGFAATITGTAAKGASIPAAVTTLVNATMKTIQWLKLKFAVGTCIAALAAGVAAIALAGSGRSHGEQLRVEGYIEVTKTAGDETLKQKVLFMGLLHGCAYFLQITNSGYFDKIEAGYDGKQLMMVHYFPRQLEAAKRAYEQAPEAVKKFLREEPNPGVNPDQVRAPETSVGLLQGTIPRSYPDATVPILWLGFASECFFKKGIVSSMIPLYDLNPLLSPNRLVRYRLRPSAPFLPEHLTFLSDGVSDRINSVKWNPPFDHGFTNAIFTVDAMTNVGSVALPSRFSLREFLPKQAAGPGDQQLREIAAYECVVTNVNVVANRKLLPELPTGTEMYFSDERFVGGHILESAIGYVTNRLLSLEEVRGTVFYPSAQMSRSPNEK